MSMKLQKTYSVVCEETKFEWKISEKNVMKVNKEDFLTLAPHVYGLVRVVCDGMINIQRIHRPTLANTDGSKEPVELRNEAQRDALEPAEKRARRTALTKLFGDGKKATKCQGFSSKGGRKGDTVTLKVNGIDVVMLPPLRADEPPRVKCDEDMVLTCLEYMKMRILGPWTTCSTSEHGPQSMRARPRVRSSMMMQGPLTQSMGCLQPRRRAPQRTDRAHPS